MQHCVNENYKEQISCAPPAAPGPAPQIGRERVASRLPSPRQPKGAPRAAPSRRPRPEPTFWGRRLGHRHLLSTRHTTPTPRPQLLVQRRDECDDQQSLRQAQHPVHAGAPRAPHTRRACSPTPRVDERPHLHLHLHRTTRQGCCLAHRRPPYAAACRWRAASCRRSSTSSSRRTCPSASALSRSGRPAPPDLHHHSRRLHYHHLLLFLLRPSSPPPPPRAAAGHR